MRYLAITFLAVLISSCGYKARPLLDPSPIAVSTKSDVKDAIKNALKMYEWVIESEKLGVIVARQNRRSHSATVQITYNSKEVRIAYLDSNNLNYGLDKMGQRRIHATYQRWIDNLVKSISSQVSY